MFESIVFLFSSDVKQRKNGLQGALRGWSSFLKFIHDMRKLRLNCRLQIPVSLNPILNRLFINWKRKINLYLFSSLFSLLKFYWSLRSSPLISQINLPKNPSGGEIRNGDILCWNNHETQLYNTFSTLWGEI